jgi:hypothetical protein
LSGTRQREITLNTEPKQRRAGDEDGPPTLPLPSAWRLVAAAIVILGFLYLMYETARKAEEAPPPASSSRLSAVG